MIFVVSEANEQIKQVGHEMHVTVMRRITHEAANGHAEQLASVMHTYAELLTIMNAIEGGA